MITVSAPLQLWTGASGTWHFIEVRRELSDEVRAYALMERRGFGSVRVTASIADVSWQTSLFPTKDGGYLLPVKKGILRQLGLVPGEEARVTLELE